MGDLVAVHWQERNYNASWSLKNVILDERSSSLLFTRPPGRVWSTTRGKSLWLESPEIQADANLVLMPSRPGEILEAGWKFGFIQLQIQEVNWLYYQGDQQDDGSMVVDSAVPSARSVSVCRDSEAEGVVWYNGAGPVDSSKTTDKAMPLPWRLPTFYFGDKPSEEVKLERTNPRTRKVNRLEEAKVAFSFLTTLSVRDPQARFMHRHYFEWGITWHAKRYPGTQDYPLIGGSGSRHSVVRTGEPGNAIYRKLLRDETRGARCCNEVASMAGLNPSVKAEGTWMRPTAPK